MPTDPVDAAAVPAPRRPGVPPPYRGPPVRRPGDVYEAEEKYEQDVHYAPVITTMVGRLGVRADRLRGEYGAINHVHLLQTDNNVQPVMGQVHMVSVPGKAHSKHFMRDVHGDINEGQRVLKERARRGPFKDQSGRSTVMDRSAHISYRKRQGAFEITVRRGVINAELQQLLSKLSLHRMSVHGSYATIIKGTKKYRLGRLDQLDLRQLLRTIEECLAKYGSVGILITEQTAGAGALYKGRAHGARFKNAARQGSGPFVTRR